MTILVTGTAGFLGSHLAEALIKEGYKGQYYAVEPDKSQRLALTKIKNIKKTYTDIEAIASNHSIAKWRDIVNEVRDAVLKWSLLASSRGVPDDELSRHEQAFALIGHRLNFK